MISTYLLTSFLASLGVLTTWRLFNDDASFMSQITYYLKPLPEFVKKPLYECMFCMSSVWGFTWFVAFRYIFVLDFTLLQCVFSVFVIAGFVSILQGVMFILDWVLSLVQDKL